MSFVRDMRMPTGCWDADASWMPEVAEVVNVPQQQQSPRPAAHRAVRWWSPLAKYRIPGWYQRAVQQTGAP